MKGCWSIFHWQGRSTIPFYLSLLLPRLGLRAILGKDRRNQWMQKRFDGYDTDSYYELLLSLFPKTIKNIVDRVIWKFRHEIQVKKRIQSYDSTLFVDVGAHHGIHTLNAKDHFMEIIAIEPHPLNLLRLHYNLGNSSNVKIISCVISDFQGTTDLFLGYRDSKHSLNSTPHRRDKIHIPVITLSLLLQNEPRIDLIKVDVEGTEDKVLKGALDIIDRIHSWIIEVHEPHERHNWNKRMQDLGYQTMWLDGIEGGHLYAFKKEDMSCELF